MLFIKELYGQSNILKKIVIIKIVNEPAIFQAAKSPIPVFLFWMKNPLNVTTAHIINRSIIENRPLEISLT